MYIHEKITTDERLLFVILLTVAISALATLTFSMRNGHLAQFDYAVLSGFHKIRNTTLDHFFSSITWIGSLWVLLPLYIALTMMLPRYFENFEKFFGIGFFGTILTTYAIKYAMERQRPHFFSPINEMPIDFSFPSAHTAQIVAFTLLLSIVLHGCSSFFGTILMAALLLIALVVALSRMYLQVHFPTDVIAGCLIAVIWCCVAVLVVKPGVLK